MQGWWLSSFWEAGGIVLVFSWLFWVVASIVLHELGHGWAAIRLGDRTPIETGHMTWNPVVHMGTASLVALAVCGFAWGLMPVNPNRFRRRHDDALVSAAGPMMNLGLAIACTMMFAVWIGLAGGWWTGRAAVNSDLYGNFQVFLRAGVAFNLMSVIVNFIPIPPLDGYRVASSFFPTYTHLWRNEGVGLVAFLILFFVAAPRLWPVAFDMTDALTNGTVNVLVPAAPKS